MKQSAEDLEVLSDAYRKRDQGDREEADQEALLWKDEGLESVKRKALTKKRWDTERIEDSRQERRGKVRGCKPKQKANEDSEDSFSSVFKIIQ